MPFRAVGSHPAVDIPALGEHIAVGSEGEVVITSG